MTLKKRHFFDRDTIDGDVISQAQMAMDMVGTMKCRLESAALWWVTYLRYALSEELQELCTEFHKMIDDVNLKRVKPTSEGRRNTPNTFNIASDEG